MLELAAYDTLGREAKTVAIEDKRLFEIGNAERDDGNTRFHVHALSTGACTTQAP